MAAVGPMMSRAQDPYYFARDGFNEDLQRVRQKQAEWQGLLESEDTARHERFQLLHKQMAEELVLLDDDLRDIKVTINVVEENPVKFRIDSAELAERKTFVSTSAASVRELKENLRSPAALSKIESDKRQALSVGGGPNVGTGRSVQDRQAEINRANSGFIEQERNQQMELMTQQDQTLDQIATSAKKLQGAATQINLELKEQAKMLQDLDDNIDKEGAKLNFVMQRMGKLLDTSDRGQLCLILALSVSAFILMFLLIS